MKRGIKSYGTILNKLCLARRAEGRDARSNLMMECAFLEIASVTDCHVLLAAKGSLAMTDLKEI